MNLEFKIVYKNGLKNLLKIKNPSFFSSYVWIGFNRYYK